MLGLTSLTVLSLSLLRGVSGAATATRRAACPALPNPLPSPTDLPQIQALPDPWKFFNNETVRSPADWECRKAEIKTLVQEYMYGYFPDPSKETVRASRSGAGGLNLSVEVEFEGQKGSWNVTLSMPTNGVVPSREHPVPVVISAGGINDTVFTGSGVALATFNVGDVAADSPTPGGAFWNLYSGRDIGVLTAWAWGFSRILDGIILTAPEFDQNRVGVIGCSRDGKSALAAGIFDDRINLVMPMSSGAEGIAPWRFQFEEYGENEKITNITGGFPYWSNTVLHQFVNNTHQIPFDAHLNVALVAPRSIIWDEGTIDYWTNPEGEARVTFIAAEKVYEGLGAANKIGVAIRDSGHCDISGYTNIQAFMLNAFFGTPTNRNYHDISPYALYDQAYPWLNHTFGRK